MFGKRKPQPIVGVARAPRTREADEYVTKPRVVRAMRFSGTPEQGAELVRWLTKWDVEAEFLPEDNSQGNRIRWEVESSWPLGGLVFAGEWFVITPRDRKVQTMSDAEFRKDHE